MNQSPQTQYEIIDDSLTFKELFMIAFSYRYLILLITGISLLLGIVYMMFFTVPVYVARGELLLKPAQQSVLTGNPTSQPTQLIRVNDALIRIRGAGITDSVIVKTNSFAYIALEKKNFSKLAYFSANPPQETLFIHVLKVDNPSSNSDYLVVMDEGTELGKGIFNERFMSPYFVMTLTDLDDIDSFDIILDPLDLARDRILNNLSLTNYRDSNVIQFSYRSTQPSIARAMVNTYMREYSYRNLLDKREDASALRVFLERQFNEIAGELDTAEKKYLNFKKNAGVVSLDEQTTQYITLLRFLEEKRIDYQIKLAEAEASKEKNETLLTGAPEFEIFSKFASSPSFQENSVFRELYGKIAELQIENARLTAEYNSSHPIVAQNQAELTAARKRLEEEIANRVDDATKGVDPFLRPVIEKQLLNVVNVEVYQRLLQQVHREIRVLEDQINDLPQAELDQAQIERDLTINEQTYNQLRSKLQEARIMEGSTINDVEIINWAEEPDSPVSPSKGKILLASLFGGIFLSLVAVTGVEFFRKSYGSVDQIERDLNAPILSVIPRMSLFRNKGRQIIVERATQKNRELHHVAELFRSSFVNTVLINGNKTSRTYVFTSALPKEGKSVITANMAIAASLARNKILIIDCDFRNPVQHKIFSRPNKHGLSELLGDNSSKGIIQTGYHNVFLSPPGGVKDITAISQMINEESFSQKIHALEEYFDYIFIDTPPVHVYSDASLISSYFANTIFIMKFDTDRDAIHKAVNTLESVNTKIKGVIVNDMHTSHFKGKTYSRYAYSYYSGYGYGG